MADIGAQNAIIGDENLGIDLPSTELPDEILVDARKKARFSKTTEYKELKDYIEARISFFQQFLPDGKALTKVPAEERGNMWVIANAVIGELRGITNAYEQAALDVKEAAKHAR